MRRTPITSVAVCSCLLVALGATSALPMTMAGYIPARATTRAAVAPAATPTANLVRITPEGVTTATATVTRAIAVTPTPAPGAIGTVPATGTATVASPVATPPITSTPKVTGTATLTATIKAIGTVTATSRATVTPRPTARATATPRPTARPRATPNPHPGFGAVPWKEGEYAVWTISGRDVVSGTAYQLFTRAGHQWVDSSAYTLVQQRQYALLPSTTTVASRTAFDANTYRLRRYDGVGLRQTDDPDDFPAGSVLRATLFGPHLDYTSYQSWGPKSGSPRKGCTVSKGLLAPATTVAYGMMPDLLRTISVDAARPVTYTVFDPYGKRPTAVASYRALGRETLRTILGTVTTVHVRFLEGAQPPLDVWYTTGRGHVVVKWGQPGAFTATLTRYVKGGSRTVLPVPQPRVALPTGSTACV